MAARRRLRRPGDENDEESDVFDARSEASDVSQVTTPDGQGEVESAINTPSPQWSPVTATSRRLDGSPDPGFSAIEQPRVEIDIAPPESPRDLDVQAVGTEAAPKSSLTTGFEEVVEGNTTEPHDDGTFADCDSTDDAAVANAGQPDGEETKDVAGEDSNAISEYRNAISEPPNNDLSSAGQDEFGQDVAGEDSNAISEYHNAISEPPNNDFSSAGLDEFGQVKQIQIELSLETQLGSLNQDIAHDEQKPDLCDAHATVAVSGQKKMSWADKSDDLALGEDIADGVDYDEFADAESPEKDTVHDEEDPDLTDAQAAVAVSGQKEMSWADKSANVAFGVDVADGADYDEFADAESPEKAAKRGEFVDAESPEKVTSLELEVTPTKSDAHSCGMEDDGGSTKSPEPTNRSGKGAGKANGKDGRKDKGGKDGGKEDGKNGLKEKVPWGSHYFLHDNRADENEAEEKTDSNSEDEKSEDTRDKCTHDKGNRDPEKKSRADDGPWPHDKYYEMIDVPPSRKREPVPQKSSWGSEEGWDTRRTTAGSRWQDESQPRKSDNNRWQDEKWEEEKKWKISSWDQGRSNGNTNSWDQSSNGNTKSWDQSSNGNTNSWESKYGRNAHETKNRDPDYDRSGWASNDDRRGYNGDRDDQREGQWGSRRFDRYAKDSGKRGWNY